MASSSPPEHQARGALAGAAALSDLGDVAALIVRRMNERHLSPSSVADVVAQDLAALLGGDVAVVLRAVAGGAHESATIRRHESASAPSALQRTIERRADEGDGAQDFVDVVLDTGQSFLSPERSTSGVPDTSGSDQQLLAVPVVAQDETIGVIAASRHDDEPFSGDDLELMTRVADVTALAVRPLSVATPDPDPEPAEGPEEPEGRELRPGPEAAAPDPQPTRPGAPAGAPGASLDPALESAADAIFIIDTQGRLLSSNLATKRLLGYSDRELVGRALHDIVAGGGATRRSRDLPDFEDPTIGEVAALYEVEMQRDDGAVVAVELSFGKVMPSECDLFVAIGRDVSRRKRSEERLRREASLDPLTGLVNRASLHRALGRSLHRADAGGRQLAVLFLDLDGFKDINDTSGHQAGDEVLRAVAERLSECVRHEDLVARYGGDEFIIVLEADDDIEDEVGVVCSRIEAAFTRPFVSGSSTHEVGASIGRAIHPGDGTTISQLLAHADADMYRIKRSGRRSTEGPEAPP